MSPFWLFLEESMEKEIQQEEMVVVQWWTN